jgi:hypothetical protein
MKEWRIDRWLEEPDEPGPVTCAICGCRVTEVSGLEGTAWRHFQLVPGQDARGCRPSCLEELHGSDGNVLPFAGLETLMSGGEAAPA